MILAEESGHRVLFTPSYFSDLQLMELVWAFVEGNMGQKYSTTTNSTDVKDCIDLEFEYLDMEKGKNTISKMIDYVFQKVASHLLLVDAEEFQYENEGIRVSDKEEIAHSGSP